jgi:long-chain fatty acid transport protein
MKKHLLVTGSLLLSSALSFGAGYQLNLQGLRQLAMGGSGTAIPWDVSTIFYNPGALATIDNFQVNASALAYMPKTRYVQTPGVYSLDAEDNTFIPFNVYIGSPIAYKSRTHVGVGVYTPFGTTMKWGNDWAGRYLVQDFELNTIFIQPTVSYKISDAVSVGGGLIYALGNMEMHNALPLQNEAGQDGSVEHKGDGNGWGFNLGVHWTASERVQFGLTYRSHVDLEIERGYARFNVPSSLTANFPYTVFSTTMALPQVISAGIGFKANENLTLQADINVVGWGAYDDLAFDYEQEVIADTRTSRRYRTTFAVRGGANYDFSDRLAVMLGAAWDRSPVRNRYVHPDAPDADRGVLSGGVSYKPWERMTITAAAEFMTTDARDASFEAENFSGVYRTTAFTPGLGVTFDF